MWRTSFVGMKDFAGGVKGKNSFFNNCRRFRKKKTNKSRNFGFPICELKNMYVLA